MNTYRAVMLTRKGGPEVLQTVDLPLVEPGPGEVRVAVRATGAGGTDVTMRRGTYPYAPPIPFVPGYEVVGEVEAVGPGVTDLRVGQRVAALLVHGGYAEKVVRSASEFVPVPDGIDDAQAVALILNYVTAYQAIHRSAKVQPGQHVLVTGANGGVGVAALELLRVAGAHAIGASSRKHHEAIRALGATPVEGRATPIDEGVRAIRPEGVDAALDGLGGKYVGQCVRATRRGGTVVAYGFSGATRDGKPSNLAAARGMLALFVGAKLRGRASSFYGITMLYRKDPRPFREDLPKLFALLAEGKITPPIAARLPLLAAREANEMLERGGLEGKIVHLAALAS
ncbi:MAG: medium chain dehydrogenase/reductase family protein [Minicystis sp.]